MTICCDLYHRPLQVRLFVHLLHSILPAWKCLECQSVSTKLQRPAKLGDLQILDCVIFCILMHYSHKMLAFMLRLPVLPKTFRDVSTVRKALFSGDVSDVLGPVSCFCLRDGNRTCSRAYLYSTNHTCAIFWHFFRPGARVSQRYVYDKNDDDDDEDELMKLLMSC